MNMTRRLYRVAAAWALAHAAAAHPAPASLGLGRIEQITLTVEDVARAEAFYEDTPGLRKLLARPNLLIFALIAEAPLGFDPVKRALVH